MTIRFARDRSVHQATAPWADRVAIWWDALRTGIWPVPLGMVAVAFAAHQAALWLDGRLNAAGVRPGGWLDSGNGADAGLLLSTLVTAIITISSIVFSITIVTLTLAANQFGSRLVRTYMADLPSKLSLGLFVMTVVYSLLALQTVSEDMAPQQVPHVTVSVALLLGMASVLVLVLFLHNVARSIVADEVIRRVSRELESSIASLEPAPRSGDDAAADPMPEGGAGALLRSRKEGYVQSVHYERLVAAAARHQVRIVLTFRAGTFMCREGWLARVEPASALNPQLAESIHAAILIGPLRTPTQDLEYSMRHLIDVALRALSPGINDANTAMVVIDRLRAALSALLGKRLPAGRYVDRDGQLRVVGPCHDHADLLDYAFAQIRRAAAVQPAVIIRLLLGLGRMAEHAQLPQQCAALAHQARLAAAGAMEVSPLMPSDRQEIARALEATLQKVSQVEAALRQAPPRVQPVPAPDS